MSELNNGNGEDRRKLIESLWAGGYHASELSSGGDTMHVVVPIYELGEDQLLIATGAIDSLCDVSLMGWRGGEQVQANIWIDAQSLDDAVAAFKKFWDERKQWLERYRDGELDL